MARVSAEYKGFSLRTPLLLFGMAALVVGLLLLGAAIARLTQLRAEIPGDLVPWFRDILRDDPSRGYHLIANILGSAVGVVGGAILILLGLANVRPIRGSGARAPAFRNNEEVVRGMRDSEVPLFRPSYSLGSYLLRGLSGGRVAFLPEAARGVFLANVAFLRIALVLVTVVVVIFFLDDYVFSAVDPPPVLPAAAGLLAVICGIFAVKLAASALLTPFTTPPLEAAHEKQVVTNAGDPSSAHSLLKETAEGLASPGGSTRCWEETLDLSGGGIADRGRVKGSILVETDAELAPPPRPYAGLVLLAAGLVLLPLGLLGLIHLDVRPDPFGSREVFLKFVLPDALNKTVIFFLCGMYGAQFLGQARTLLARTRYTSLAYLVELSGAYGRAALHVGKAAEDSIESETVAVSSDLSFTYHAANLLSEGAQADSPRYLVALTAPEQPGLVFEPLRNQVGEFAARGIEIRGPEAVATDLARIARLNVAISARRVAAERQSGREGIESPAAPPLTEAEMTPTQEQRRCPNCGEVMDSAAKFCKSCGHQLLVGDSSAVASEEPERGEVTLRTRCSRDDYTSLSDDEVSRLLLDFLALIKTRYPDSEFGYDSFPDLDYDEVVLSTIFQELKEAGNIKSSGYMRFQLAESKGRSKGHTSVYAGRLQCQRCGKTYQAEEWPLNGDRVPFYFQTEPGNFQVLARCPHCNKDWYVVWDDDPGPVTRLTR
jgi:hypothetical protein